MPDNETIKQMRVKGTLYDIEDQTARESGGTVRSVNGKTGTVNLNAEDVGALPDDTVIPSKTSDLTNDLDFATIDQVPTKTSDLTNDSDFASIDQVPTKTSDLTNDSGFITNEDFNVDTLKGKTLHLINDSSKPRYLYEIAETPGLIYIGPSGSYSDETYQVSVTGGENGSTRYFITGTPNLNPALLIGRKVSYANRIAYIQFLYNSDNGDNTPYIDLTENIGEFTSATTIYIHTNFSKVAGNKTIAIGDDIVADKLINNYDYAPLICIGNSSAIMQSGHPSLNMAIGTGVSVRESTIFGIALGAHAKVINNGIAISYGNSGSLAKNSGIAIHDRAEATARYSLCFGVGGKAHGYSSLCFNASMSNGMYSVAIGSGSIAGSTSSNGKSGSIAVGSNIKVNAVNSIGIGQNNKELTADYSFAIGNGTTSNDENRSNSFRVDADGNVYGLSAYNSSGADYAEYFEWLDGNKYEEDRVGFFVTLNGKKILKANRNDYILGIISGLPAMIGNADEDWQGRWLHDEYGRFIFAEVDVERQVEKINPETGETEVVTEIIKEIHHKPNPAYDPSQSYIERKDRPEWAAVGMMGVLAVRDDGTCQVNGFCDPADGGIATAGTKYRVIERVSENVVKIIFK